MTREEAIRTLTDLQDGSYNVYEAIRMAIEALSEKHQLSEETPTNTPTDLIRRSDALDKLAEESYHNEEDYRTAVKVIGSLPTADRPYMAVAEVKVDTEEIIERIKEEYEIVDRPHGEWVRKVDETTYWYECSECGTKMPLTQWKSEWESNYCPQCGAEMYERRK